MNYLVIIDKHYLCYLHSLLESWWTNYRKGKAKWHIHYISESHNDSTERLDNNTLILLRKHCAYFQNCNPNVTFEISITKSTLDADGREIPVGLHHNGNRRLTRFMAYCANIRTQIIPDILANLDNNDLLIYLDVDSLIRGCLDHVSKLLTKYDTMLFFSDETYKRIHSKHRDNTSARYTYLKSGLIGIRKTANSVAFFDRYKSGVQELGLTNWGSDQQALVEIYEAKKFPIKIGFWNNIYLDWHFKKDSLIWMGKGTRKDGDKIYLAEYNFYRKKWKKKLQQFV